MKAKWLAAGFAVFLIGCVHEVGFNAAYVGHRPPDVRAAGKLLLVMPEKQRTSVYRGTADSRRGSDRTLTVPIGAIDQQISEMVLGSCFQQGAAIAEDLASVEHYALAVEPNVVSFVYRYVDVPQEPWQGGAGQTAKEETARERPVLIVPQVEVTLSMKVFDHRGRRVLTRSYRSGTVSGKGYFVSNAPAEVIDELLHQTLHHLTMQAAADVSNLLGGTCHLRPRT